MNNIFICGCGHSGTTLLLALLLEHSQCHGLKFESRAFFNLKEESIEGYYRKYYQENYIYFVEKTPTHVYKINAIKRQFPLSKIIICYRNPLDTIASLKLRGFSLDYCISRYINDNLEWLGKENIELIKIRYEDLVKNPMKTINDLCLHLNLVYEPSMFNFYNNSELFFNITDDKYHNYLTENYTNKYMPRLEGDSHRLFRNYQLKTPLSDMSGSYINRLTSEEIFYILPKIKNIANILGYTL